MYRTLWFRIAFGSRPRVTLMRTIITGTVLVLVGTGWLRPALVDGDSMFPTIRDREFRVLNLLSYRMGEPQRFDIVAIQGADKRHMFLKRILALPGEKIEWQRGKLLINGVALKEEYLVGAIDWDMPSVQLEEREYFVAGDNRGIEMSHHVLGRTYRRFIYAKLLW